MIYNSFVMFSVHTKNSVLYLVKKKHPLSKGQAKRVLLMCCCYTARLFLDYLEDFGCTCQADLGNSVVGYLDGGIRSV